MSNRKLFVLDTNVLMNDPSSVKKFDDNNVFVPYTVVQELDRLKSGNDSRCATARQAIRSVDDCIGSGEVIHQESYSFWKSSKKRGGNIFIAGPGISGNAEKNDDNIIKSAERISQLFGDDAILVTDDISLQIKARAGGLNVQKYQNQRVKDVSFYDEIPTVCVSKELIDKVYDSSGPDISMNDIINSGLDDYMKDGTQNNVILKAGSRSALVRLNHMSLKRVRRNIEASGIKPRNKEQQFAMDILQDKDVELVALAGKAGTGKTLLALASGFHQVTDLERYDRMTVARPVEPMGREIGFTPGTVEEKLDPWMKPIYDNFERIMENDNRDGKRIVRDIKHQNWLELDALTYIRGRSISNQFLIIDEAQNLSTHEIKTIVTRAGEGTKIVLTGDPYQIDSTYLDQYNNGLSYVIDRMRDQEVFASVTLTQGERSNLAEVASDCL